MRTPILVLALGALLLASVAQAAEICATSTAGFEFALAVAEGNGEDDIIQLTTGTFDAPAGGFEYSAGATENFDLTISGGWSEFFGNPCGQQLEGSPASTINGQLLERGLDVKLHAGGDLTIRRLNFQNGFVGDPNRGAGLKVRAESGYGGVVRIERNLFFNNEAKYGGALSVTATGSGNAQVHVLNNIFTLNHGRAFVGAVELLLNGGNDSLFGARMTFVNNTVTGNTTDSTFAEATGGAWISGNVPAKYVINNNLWSNQEIDLRVASTSTSFVLRHNNIEESLFHQAPTSEAGNIAVEPEYEPCGTFICLSFVPRIGSPLVDGGTEPGMFSAWDVGNADYHGKDRIHGKTIDIGASESHALIFADRFEQ